jgi:anthranilate synthase/aminodeoxychorismate synthase-like glutamine amidotransferase
MLLMIDNYDSFTYNLYQYFCELDQEVEVVRNDRISLKEIETRHPEQIVISPGPSTPLQSGISNQIIRHFGPELPILGVCLGHQCIGYCYGGTVSRAKMIMHGKSSAVHHTGEGLFKGLPEPLSVIRYHSLAVKKEDLPDCLEVTAWTEDGTIMGLRHRQYRVQGVQFHPESFMTQCGKELLSNFLEGRG